MLSALMTLTLAQGAMFRWTSDATTEYLAKRGDDREAIVGARIEGAVILDRVTIAIRAQASAKPDGGATQGVSFDDPHTFDSVEGYLSLSFRVQQWVSFACVGGVSADVERGRVRVFEQYPLTGGCGARFDYRGAYVYAMVGVHQASGEGTRFLTTIRVPTGGRTSFIANGALGAKQQFLLAGVALSLKGSAK